MEAVAPPRSPPKVPYGYPLAPPHSGGEPSEFRFWKIRQVVPPCSPPTSKILPKIGATPPLSGGEHAKITEMLPPHSGGEHEKISENLQKPEIGWLPPKPPKVPPQNTLAPPCQGGGVLVAVGSPQGFWGSDGLHPQNRGSPPPCQGGTEDPYPMMRHETCCKC